MTEFGFKLALLGLPGIAAYFLLVKLTGRPAKNTLETFLVILLLSLLSYSLFGLAESTTLWLFGRGFDSTILNEVARQGVVPASWRVLGAGAFGVLTAYVFSYGVRFRVVNRIGEFIGATNRYGDEDVWHYFHALDPAKKGDGWLVVRDADKNLMYLGHVDKWSESERKRELLMSDVTVLTNDHFKQLYECHSLYVSGESLSLEVPIRAKTESESVKDGKGGGNEQ